MDAAELAEKARKARALEHEDATKNWFKIPLKFGLWLVFLGTMLVLLLRRKVTARNRKWLYLGSAAVFGVALGADPSPMGTVKDAIALFGAEGVIFPPRMVALAGFLLTVIVANKFICSWGCQFGVVQDFLFRLNRNRYDRKGILRQYKPPFVWTNAFRVAFFVVFTAVAMIWATDIVGRARSVQAVQARGARAFRGRIPGRRAGGVAVRLSAVVPGCSARSGLVGWVAEKISLTKIGVDYSKCNACTSCVAACPSDVMGAILKQDRVIPDCFACGTCVEACPSQAISFRFGKRQKPPAGHFEGRE